MTQEETKQKVVWIKRSVSSSMIDSAVCAGVLLLRRWAFSFENAQTMSNETAKGHTRLKMFDGSSSPERQINKLAILSVFKEAWLKPKRFPCFNNR